MKHLGGKQNFEDFIKILKENQSIKFKWKKIFMEKLFKPKFSGLEEFEGNLV